MYIFSFFRLKEKLVETERSDAVDKLPSIQKPLQEILKNFKVAT